MTTPRLILLACAALIGLGLGDELAGVLGAGRPWVFAALCVVVLVAAGELWLRALAGEAMPPVLRIGLATAAGLVSLPFVAIVLHVAGVGIRARSIGAGLALVVTVLGAIVLLRERAGRPPGDPRLPGAIAAVTIPALLAVLTGFLTLSAYDRMPRPPEPGYTSLALNGWAGDIDGPLSIPARGVVVPLRVSRAGLPAAAEPLRVRVGARLVSGRALAVEPGVTRAFFVHVPAPPDSCLHRIEISLGVTSTVFYGRGPAGRGSAGC
ncbi:hypothetical protein [Actinoplanes solisilvae]|uniref:hypothetical protein n=1 Tax=Actinoplanes solisilvae TaxID=2486853 RepID=UPI000FD7E5B7|nr:hypothetical protein [Actinoplanes solisilvae]